MIELIQFYIMLSTGHLDLDLDFNSRANSR